MIADIIEKSKYMLLLKYDYDDQGGIPPTKETLETAIDFAKSYPFDLESINHGPDGSVDILYKGKRNGLVNIMPNGNSRGYWEGMRDAE